MLEINRAVVIVRPKQPFLDWLRSVDPDDSDLELEEIRRDPNAYLVPDWEEDNDRWVILGWCVENIFGNELWSWYTDESLWPTERDYDMFLNWFDVEFYPTVVDIDTLTPLEHIDDGDDQAEPSAEIDPHSNGH